MTRTNTGYRNDSENVTCAINWEPLRAIYAIWTFPSGVEVYVTCVVLACVPFVELAVMSGTVATCAHHA